MSKPLYFETFTLGALATNCYLIWNDDTRQAVIIDPADDGDFLSEEISRRDLILEKIILTHGHFDHVLGLLSLKLNFPQAPIYLHPDDAFLLRAAAKSAEYWLKISVDPVPSADLELKAGTEIVIAGEPFLIIATPGHTPGSVAFYNEGLGRLIAGDTIFKDAVGRTDFKYSDPGALQESIRQLLALPAPTVILSGHGEQTTVGAERRHFNFPG